MRQIAGRWPATERVYVPDDASEVASDNGHHLISKVHVFEAGPDRKLLVYVRGFRDVTLTVPREDEEELLARLFGEYAVPATDREAIQTLLDELEDSIAAVDAEKRTLARRRIVSAFGSILRDLATAHEKPQPPDQEDARSN